MLSSLWQLLKFSHCHISLVSASLTAFYYCFNNLAIDWHLVLLNYHSTFIIYFLDNIFDSQLIYKKNNPQRYLWQINNIRFFVIHIAISLICCLYILAFHLKFEALVIIIIASLFYLFYRFIIKSHRHFNFLLKSCLVCLTWLLVTVAIPMANEGEFFISAIYFGNFLLLFLNYLFCNAQDYQRDKAIQRINILNLITRKRLIKVSFLIIIISAIILVRVMNLANSLGYIFSFLILLLFFKRGFNKKESLKSSFALDCCLVIPLLINLFIRYY